MRNELDRLANKKKLTSEDLSSSPIYKDLKYIITSLNISNPRQVLSHAMSGLTSIPKCNCGTDLQWNPDSRQYRTYCSKACTAKFTVAAKKEKNKEQLGVEWHTQLSNWADKVKETSLQRYGVDHYSKTPEHRTKTVRANLAKFNVEYPAQSPEIQIKMKSTCVDKYGVDNPAKNKTVASKTINTCVDKYGVSNVAQQHYSQEAYDFLTNDMQFAIQCNLTPVRVLAKKYNISVKPIYDKLTKLGIRLPNRQISTFEAEVNDFIQTFYKDIVITNDWSIIKNKQLDIVLPEIKIAIECNGTYWHAELQGRGSNYHNEKTKFCKEAGYTLIHIWEHDWYNKNSIVKSMLMSRLTGIETKIHARKCTLQVVEPNDTSAFLDKNHLQGRVYDKAINIGLYHHNELVSLMVFGKSRFNAKYQWELLRFANKANCLVMGGASKLFRYFVNAHRPDTVVSFADRMYSTGNVYHVLGFVYSGTSKPGYKYTKNYVDVYNRLKFQKHKLKKVLPAFDDLLSESQNMKKNGYDKIWDCGNDIYVWQGPKHS